MCFFFQKKKRNIKLLGEILNVFPQKATKLHSLDATTKDTFKHISLLFYSFNRESYS